MNNSIKILIILFLSIAFLNYANAEESDLQSWLCVENSHILKFGDDFTFENIGHGGYDRNRWRPEDKINIYVEAENDEVETENPDNNRIDNMIAEIAIFSPKNGKNIVDKMHFNNLGGEILEIGDLEYGEEKGALFDFNVPIDLEPTHLNYSDPKLFNNGLYVLGIKMYGRSVSGNEVCISYTKEIEIENNSYGDRLSYLEQRIFELENENSELKEATNRLEYNFTSLQKSIDRILIIINDLPRRFTK